jgi:hypothetical protein
MVVVPLAESRVADEQFVQVLPLVPFVVARICEAEPNWVRCLLEALCEVHSGSAENDDSVQAGVRHGSARKH